MYNFLMVDINKSLNKLIEIILQLALSYPLPLLHHLIQSVIRTQFQNDVDVLAILEDVVKKDYILMF